MSAALCVSTAPITGTPIELAISEMQGNPIATKRSFDVSHRPWDGTQNLPVFEFSLNVGSIPDLALQEHQSEESPKK